MRDATRGGVATVLNEIARAARAAASEIDETSVPIREAVKRLCEILGLDPLYLANEGKLVASCPGAAERRACRHARAHAWRRRRCIGASHRSRRQVVMRTALGGQRIVDMLVGDQLPRIC